MWDSQRHLPVCITAARYIQRSIVDSDCCWYIHLKQLLSPTLSSCKLSVSKSSSLYHHHCSLHLCCLSFLLKHQDSVAVGVVKLNPNTIVSEAANDTSWTPMPHINCTDMDCVDDEEYQTEFLSYTTRPMENSAWGYHDYPNEMLQSFPRAPLDTAMLHDLGAHHIFSYREAPYVLAPQQFPPFWQSDLSQPLPTSQYFPLGHVNVRPLTPFYSISEPQTMISRGLDYTTTRSIPPRMDFEMPTPTNTPGSISPTGSSPSLSFMSSPEQCYPYTAWFPRIPCSPQREDMMRVGNESNEDDVPFDKPYAQLIYDALMQAPGHRMLLRDIYEWFIENTKKPRESGTNGWQNSIRHNLSMNQVGRV